MSEQRMNTGSGAAALKRGRRKGGPEITKGTLKTAKRLLGYVTSTYKVQFIVVLFCILMSSIASISVSLSLKFLLDDFIIPLIGQDRQTRITVSCTPRCSCWGRSSCWE